MASLMGSNFVDFYETYVEALGNADENGFVKCRCVFHSDKKPSATFNIHSGVYTCFSCNSNGDKVATWSPVKFLVEHTGITWQEASYIVDEYRRDNELVEPKFKDYVKIPQRIPKFESLVSKAQALLSPDNPQVIEYIKVRGLSYDILKELGVGWLPAEHTNWKRDSLVFPYIYNGRVTGIHYRDSLGNKGGEPKSHMIPWGVDDIPPNTKAVIIVEGESDRLRLAIALKELGVYGNVFPISVPTCSFAREWARELQGVECIGVLAQSDEASQRLVKAVQSIFRSKTSVLILPWKRREVGKDVCDWFKYNTNDELQKVLVSILNYRTSTTLTGWELESTANAEGEQPELIKNLLFRQQIGMIVGPQKSYKTWIAFNLVRSLLLKVPFLGINELAPTKDDIEVFIIEEEGSKSKLYERAKAVFSDVPQWREKTYWWHKRRVKIDDDFWIDEIKSVLDKHPKIGLIILDCMQRLHTANEDSATEMMPFWDNLQSITSRYPNVSILIVHHFNKTGVVSDKWKAIRGSSRAGGETDLAFFVEKKSINQVQMSVDGRDIPPLTGMDGSDVFSCTFTPHTWLLSMDTTGAVTDRTQGFLQEMTFRKRWHIKDASIHMGANRKTIKSWIEGKLSEWLNLEEDGSIQLIKIPYVSETKD